MDPHRLTPRSETSAAEVLQANLDAQRELAEKVGKALELLEKRGNGGGNGGWLGKLLSERVIALMLAAIIALVMWIGVVNVRQAVLDKSVTRNESDIQQLMRYHNGSRP